MEGSVAFGEQSLWWDESPSLHRAVRPFYFVFPKLALQLTVERLSVLDGDGKGVGDSVAVTRIEVIESTK